MSLLTMPQFCSCGAELAPEARFCHKCGKPQGDWYEPVAEPIVPEPPPPVAIPTAPPALLLIPSFRNPIAVRTGLLAASLATLLNMAMFLGFAIWLVSAGFFSAYLFGRRTGQFLSVRAGARMGWITGILSFVFGTVLFTLGVVGAASRSGGLGAFYRDQVQAMGMHDPNLDQAVRILETPSGLAMMFILSLSILFAIFTVLCMAGGALGAKVLDREEG